MQVPLAPKFRGLGSDFITTGAEPLLVVAVVNTGEGEIPDAAVVVLVNWSIPDCVNWASCSEVKISGAFC